MRCLALAFLLLSMPAAAKTLDSLMAEDKLRLDAWLSPDEGIVVGQEVRLTIEVSTPRWFAGGTRITLPEIDKVVVLRRNQFATNLSRREADTTWVIQQWQLELYAQRPGARRIPSITLELAVNDAEAGIVRGELTTEPLAFSAGVPPALAGIEVWLAAPNFSVEQTFDRELAGLKPGDAFTRTIELRATNLNAMMLPEPLLEELDGLPAYPELPELEDRSNRGEATAIRRESVTYLVEREGQYRLPEQTFYWWNTETRRVETSLLPAVEIDAGAAPPVTQSPGEPRLPRVWQAAPLLAGVLLLALLAGLVARKRRAAPTRLLHRADRALARGEPGQAAALLYQWLNTRPAGTDWLSLRNTAASACGGELSREVESLLRAAYSASDGNGAGSGRISARLVKQQALSRASGRRSTSLALNPTQPR